MHTVQMLLIEADTHQEAIRRVLNKLSSDVSDDFWSDWWDVGGRWKGIFGENAPDAICYSPDTELFEKHLKEFSDQRVAQIKELKNLYDTKEKKELEQLIDEYDPTKEDFHLGFDFYPLKSMLRIMSGEWTPDTCYYDLESMSAYQDNFRSRLAENPEKQFGVAVDFHF